jgi:hypothetical protein
MLFVEINVELLDLIVEPIVEILDGGACLDHISHRIHRKVASQSRLIATPPKFPKADIEHFRQVGHCPTSTAVV